MVIHSCSCTDGSTPSPYVDPGVRLYTCPDVSGLPAAPKKRSVRLLNREWKERVKARWAVAWEAKEDEQGEFWK